MIASRETILSLLYRIGTIGFSFASVSWLIRNLGSERYGAWATLVSALVWIQMSDLGIGYVLKNRVAAREDPQALCGQIAAAARVSFLTGLLLCGLYVIGGSYLSIVRDHRLEANLLYVTAFLSLPTMLGINLLQGLGMARVSFLVSMLQSLAWLGIVVFLGQEASLRQLASAFAGLWLASNLYIFHRAYRTLALGKLFFFSRLWAPRMFRDALPLIRVGAAFFFLQLTGLILFNLGTYLAYTYFSADAAARYDILNKIFQIPMTLFNVLIAIAWASIATLLSQSNFNGARRIHTQLVVSSLIGGFFILGISLAAVPPFVHVYSHGKLEVGRPEVFWFAMQICVQMVAYAGAVFMNAVERLRLQIAFAMVSTAAFLPLFFLCHSMDIAAIPFVTMLVVLPGAAFFNIYARRHIVAPPRTPLASSLPHTAQAHE